MNQGQGRWKGREIREEKEADLFPRVAREARSRRTGGSSSPASMAAAAAAAEGAGGEAGLELDLASGKGGAVRSGNDG